MSLAIFASVTAVDAWRESRSAVPSAGRPSRHARFDRFTGLIELPIAAMALLIAPALVAEGHASTQLVRELARTANWVIWLAFCGTYASKFCLAPDRREYLRTGWPDLLIVLLAAP